MKKRDNQAATGLPERSARNCWANISLARVKRLFFHRTDGYAEMWKARDGRIGYSPVCQQGKPWSCGQQDLIEEDGPRCGRNCHSFSPVPVPDEAIARHLAGKVTLGGYLLAEGNRCTAGVSIRSLCVTSHKDSGSKKQEEDQWMEQAPKKIMPGS